MPEHRVYASVCRRVGLPVTPVYRHGRCRVTLDSEVHPVVGGGLYLIPRVPVRRLVQGEHVRVLGDVGVCVQPLDELALLPCRIGRRCRRAPVRDVLRLQDRPVNVYEPHRVRALRLSASGLDGRYPLREVLRVYLSACVRLLPDGVRHVLEEIGEVVVPCHIAIPPCLWLRQQPCLSSAAPPPRL